MTISAQTALATEGGGSNYLPGFYGDFAMAAFPEPGTYFNNFFAAYQDTTSQTGTLLEMPGVMHVTNQKFLEGQFIVGFFPALMISKDHSGTNSNARVGLGDFYLVPGGLSWNLDNFSALLFEGIVMPTGYYHQGDFNTGRNYWTFDHNLLTTFKIPGDNELSIGIGYMNNLRNPATDYQSGDEFHFDYTVGHYFTSMISFGITGSYYQQVTKDQAPAEIITSPPGEAASIGPVVMYAPRINNQDIAISLKWLREFNATGRTEQEYIICRIFLPF